MSLLNFQKRRWGSGGVAGDGRVSYDFGPVFVPAVGKILYARSGYARSGATRSDYYKPSMFVIINGVDRTAKVTKRTLRIEQLLSEQADTAHMTVFGFTPLAGQSIVIASGAISNRIFAGTILRPKQKSIRGNAYQVFELECSDWTWTLNKKVVIKQYAAGTSGSFIVGDLVSTYAPTFSTAKVKGGAPAISGDLSFRGRKLFDAIEDVCQLMTPPWRAYPDYDQVLHFFDVETSQAPIALTPTNALYDSLEYTPDVSQICTRFYAVGGGAQTTAPVAIGATSIPVDECSWYSASGGKVLAGSNVAPYTGVSTTSGPGSLTGVSGISYAIRQGDSINVFVQADDVPAQTALATLIGGGDDGIREGWVEDDHWSQATALGQAMAKLAAYKSQDIRGSYTSYDKLTRAGKQVSIAITARSINATVTLQRVVRRLAGPNKWYFECEFSIVWADLINILTQGLG